jgi:hypothetical protein
MRLLIGFFLCFAFERLLAQPVACDWTLQRGDTLVCQAFKRKKVIREDFYVGTAYAFTRHWYYNRKDYYWMQKLSERRSSKANGFATAYYQNGQMKSTTFFENGEKIGPCVTCHPSGAVKITCERHIKGKLDGLNTHYYEDGQLEYQTRWQNGRLWEVLTYKDRQGNDLPIGTFKNGNGVWVRGQTGGCQMAYTYRNGKVVKKKRLKQ